MSPGVGYGRDQLLTCLSNTTHYTYTIQVQTNGNVALMCLTKTPAPQWEMRMCEV